MPQVAEWVRSRYYDNYDFTGLILPGILKVLNSEEV